MTGQMDDKNRARRHITLGWVVLGFFLLPVLALLVWANFTLLQLGLEAAFGFKKIEMHLGDYVVTAEDTVALVWLIAEIVAGFWLAELADWVNLLDFDERLKPSQRLCGAWVAGLLLAMLVAGEVGIGLYRQWRIEEDARLRQEALRDLSSPSLPRPLPERKGVLDLNQPVPDGNLTAQSPGSSNHADSSASLSGWARFVQSLPSVGVAIVHVAVPCLSAVCGVIVIPLTLFVSGFVLTLITVVPLTSIILPLDLLNRILRGLFRFTYHLLHLIAAPAGILVEGIIALREFRGNG